MRSYDEIDDLHHHVCANDATVSIENMRTFLSLNAPCARKFCLCERHTSAKRPRMSPKYDAKIACAIKSVRVICDY